MAGLIALFGGWSGALADPPAGAQSTAASPSSSDAAVSMPQSSFFSSLKQSLRGNDHVAVRGHFDLGTPPNVRRYYCLVDTKTGTKESNAVVGEPIPLTDAMTGIKNSAVSFYSCTTAEQQGILVTTGYVLTGAAARANATAAATASAVGAVNPAAAAVAPVLQVQAQPQTPRLPATAPIDAPAKQIDITQIEIAGLKLGMSPDEVRAVLKSKNLLNYNESSETLSYLDSAKGVMQSIPNGRFVNVIAAWTPPPASAAVDTFEVDGESFEVMFTPTPGKERAMGIIHTVGYSPANAIREVALENGLVKKYGGSSGSYDLPESPTWRLQSSGDVTLGDPCNRRGIFGGLGGLKSANTARENLALKKSPEDFKFQTDRCGIAIVTEDHFTANGGAMREDRIVTRYTVTAYSPAIGLDGAKAAAQLIQAAGGTARKSDASRARDHAAPSL
jgi:hypothetical protein